MLPEGRIPVQCDFVLCSTNAVLLWPKPQFRHGVAGFGEIGDSLRIVVLVGRFGRSVARPACQQFVDLAFHGGEVGAVVSLWRDGPGWFFAAGAASWSGGFHGSGPWVMGLQHNAHPPSEPAAEHDNCSPEQEAGQGCEEVVADCLHSTSSTRQFQTSDSPLTIGRYLPSTFSGRTYLARKSTVPFRSTR